MGITILMIFFLILTASGISFILYLIIDMLNDNHNFIQPIKDKFKKPLQNDIDLVDYTKTILLDSENIKNVLISSTRIFLQSNTNSIVIYIYYLPFSNIHIKEFTINDYKITHTKLIKELKLMIKQIQFAQSLQLIIKN